MHPQVRHEYRTSRQSNRVSGVGRETDGRNRAASGLDDSDSGFDAAAVPKSARSRWRRPAGLLRRGQSAPVHRARCVCGAGLRSRPAANVQDLGRRPCPGCRVRSHFTQHTSSGPGHQTATLRTVGSKGAVPVRPVRGISETTTARTAAGEWNPAADHGARRNSVVRDSRHRIESDRRRTDSDRRRNQTASADQSRSR